MPDLPAFAPSPPVTDTTEPDRPHGMDPRELGFTPRRPVPWLSPSLLAGTAVRVVLAELFGAYLDKRELQQALPGPIMDERPPGPDGEPADGAEMWFDYVADLGDGFNPTYSIAYLLAQPQLTVEGVRLPRGRVLIMGGDQVYPTASKSQYEDRFKGPYRAALPAAPPDGPAPVLYALPGNHDWYDGLTAFLRLFARAHHGHVGGWETRQSRSYFAVRLSQHWWLMAIDAQFGTYLDDPQLAYFREAAGSLRSGDKIILCPPTPAWVSARHDPHAYDPIDDFVRTVIAPTGAEVALMLSGDQHHYARYQAPERQLITCGTGGAFLHGTHDLPDEIEVPPPTAVRQKRTPTQRYSLRTTYPTASDSRRLAAGVFVRLPWRNPGFAALLGLVHTLLMLAAAGVLHDSTGTTEQRLVSIPLVMMTLTVVGGLTALAMPATAGHRLPRHWAFGIGHGAVHATIGILAGWSWANTPIPDLTWPLPVLVAVVLYLPLAALVATQVLSLYLLVAAAFGVNVNELFAGQSIIDRKGFLRIHIGGDGRLTIYPIALDRVCRTWNPAPQADLHQPWFEPAESLEIRFMEAPFRIS
jgi:hypothetical protein